MATAITDPNATDPTTSGTSGTSILNPKAVVTPPGGAIPIAPTSSTAASTGASTGAASSGVASGSPTAIPFAPQTPAGPATTSDPMAFQPSSAPISSLTDAQKNEYWAAQGVQTLPAGTPSTGVGANGVQQYDPAGLASANASLAAAGNADPAVSGLLGQLNQPQAPIDPYGPGGEAGAIAASQAANQAATATASAASGFGAPGYTYGGAAGDYGQPATSMNGLPPFTAPAPTTGISSLTPGGATDLGGMVPATTPTATLNGLPSLPATGGASDTNPAGQLPVSQTPAASVNGLPAASGATSMAPSATPYDPSSALTNDVIARAPTASRFDIANQQLQSEITNELEPQFQADSRTIAANSFGAGRGVSGQNRTAEGDLALQHSRDINNLTASSQANALTGTIADSQFDTQQADQQQQFEASQQGQAFSQALGLQSLSDSEKAQAIQQYLAIAGYASTGDPAQDELIAAGIFGAQSSSASTAATSAATAAANKTNTTPATTLNGLPV